MRKLTKALAAVLLCAVVLSAFGAFAAFADDSAASGLVTLWDMDAQSSVTVSNVGTDDYPQKYPTMTKDTEDDQTKWTLSMGDAQVGDSANSGDFWTIDGLGWGVRVRDDAGYGSRAGGSKNTDYLILDFDLSTDTEFIDDIYINMRVLKSGAQTYKTDLAVKAGAYPAIKRSEDGGFVICNDNGSNPVYPILDNKDKWRDVTIVYDFSYEDANYAYVYIDGIYCGNIGAPNITSAVFYFMRVQSVSDNKVDMAGTSTNFSNLTLKQVPSDYEGLPHGILGSTTPLSEIPELAYCVEDKPGNPEGYETNPKLADIKRGEEIIPVYDIDDLHGDLIDGDVVTVYADVNRLKSTGYMIKETSAGVAANVVWQDANGVKLGEEGSLFAAPTVVSVPYDAVWASLRAGVLSSGRASECYEVEGQTDPYIYDKLWEIVTVDSGNKDVVLFGDYTFYGRSYSVTNADGVASTGAGSTTNRISSGSTTIDMNGYTLTNSAKRTHVLTAYGAGTEITFKNGKLVNNAGGNNLVMVSAARTKVTIEKCESVTLSGTILDQRGGIVVYKDSTITANSALTNAKAIGSAHTGVYVLNCDITAKTSLANFAQTNEKDVGRWGSAVVGITYVDSKISGGQLMDGDIYADQGHASTAQYAANKVSHYVSVIGCEVNTTNNLTQSEVLNLPKAGENILSVVFGISISDSTITAKTLGYIWQNSADETLIDYYAAYNVKNSSLDLAAYTTGKTGGVASDCDVILGEGTKTSDVIPGGSIINPTIKLPEGCELAYTSLGGDYNCIVTPSYDTYTYKLGTQDAVEFYWNKPTDETVDEFNISKVVTLAESKVYKYTWAQDGNAFTAVLDNNFSFKAKSTLTLENDLNYNFYVEKTEEFDALLDAGIVVMINGSRLTKESATVVKDGVTYYAVRVLDIAPTAAADNAIAFSVSINGAYGEENVEVISGAASVLDYINGILTKSTNDKSIELMKAILNYITAAHAYAGTDADAKVTELLGDYKAQYAIEGAGKFAKPDGVTSISAYYGATVGWGIAGAKDTAITVQYGDEEAKTYTIGESGILYVDVPAQNFAEGITVNGVEIDLLGYYNQLSTDKDKAAVAALWNYSYAAAEYAASVAK